MFRAVLLSIIRSLFAVHSAMVYVIQVCRQLSSRSICSCSKAVYKPVWNIPLLSLLRINSWWLAEKLPKKGFFPQISSPNPATHLYFSPTCATCLPHLILPNLITRLIFGEKYKPWSSHYTFRSTPTSSHLSSAQVFSSIPHSQKSSFYEYVRPST